MSNSLTHDSRQDLIEKDKLFGLDFLRALAITMVLFFHILVLFPHPEWLASVAKFGWIGVDLFFALSGFLIASQLFAKIVEDKKISYKDFFIKRFFRIVPAYLTVLILYISFPVLWERGAPAPPWKFLTFTQNIGLDLRTQGAFSHAWSLCVEEQFYLFFPVILITLIYFNAVKKGFIILISLFVLGFLARLYAWNVLVFPFSGTDLFGVYWQEWIYYPTYARLDGLLVGISIAGIFSFKPEIKARLIKYGNLSLFVGLIVLTAAYFICLNERSFSLCLFGFPMVDIGCGFLVLGAVSSSSIIYNFKSYVVSTIAMLSYSIYLIHKIIIHVTQEEFFKFDIAKESNLMMVISLVTTALAAYLLHVIIEKPFMKYRVHLLPSTHLTPGNLHSK
jgi:peptidoglycan/LPS O-acetylase OafA/YrhL